MKTRMKNVMLEAIVVILLTMGVGHADLSDGLVAYYPFNSGADDESVNGNDGILQGDASVVWDDGGNGKPASSVLSLDGTADYVYIADSSTLALSTQGTIATFFNLDSTIDVSHDKYVGIITKMVASTNPWQIEFELYYHPHAHVGDGLYVPLLEGFVCDDSHVDYARYTEMDPRDDTWHHLAMKWDSTVATPYISLYLDGSLVDTKPLNGSGITHKGFPMYIGRHIHDTTGLWYYFKGMIDEVRIYNRALSEAEVNELVNSPPVAMCQNVTVEAGTGCEADASIDNGSYDPDGDTITIAQTPAGPYPLGATDVTLTVTDSHGASDSCTATVTVVDTTPPTIYDVLATPNVLWPPNHKMVEVVLEVDAEDICDPEPFCWILGVSCNEPINGPGDGNTDPDWEWEYTDDPLVVLLRAERAGGGSGRVYTVHVVCEDASCNSTTGMVDVIVPHDQGKGKKK